jgi:hypothetical protein
MQYFKSVAGCERRLSKCDTERVFHWAKAILTRIQNLGLVTTYREREASHTFIKQLMALPFLPSTHIADVFWLMKEKCPPQLQELVDYVDRQWMENATFPIRSWSVFQFTIRTNNDVEGSCVYTYIYIALLRVLVFVSKNLFKCDDNLQIQYMKHLICKVM